jgi:ADP-heptose:LPS heptosyltransferase
VLVGLPWASEIVARYHAYLDGFRKFPGYPGLPESEPDLAQLQTFLKGMRAERFDLAIQLHGSGATSNAVVAQFGARIEAGFYEPTSICPDPGTFLPYPGRGLELRRLLRLVEHLGIPARGEELEFPVSDDERATARRLAASVGLGARGFACIHGGASVPVRRWPVDRFAAAADALAARGLDIVLTGSEGELELTAAIARSMRATAVDLAGKTPLGTFAALLEGARLLVCNDTGVSHVADGLKVPSVVISTGDNPERWAPADGRLHRVLCRDEGATVDEVIAHADELLNDSSQGAPHGHRPIGGDATAGIDQHAGSFWQSCDRCAS